LCVVYSSRLEPGQLEIGASEAVVAKLFSENLSLGLHFWPGDGDILCSCHDHRLYCDFFLDPGKQHAFHYPHQHVYLAGKCSHLHTSDGAVINLQDSSLVFHHGDRPNIC